MAANTYCDHNRLCDMFLRVGNQPGPAATNPILTVNSKDNSAAAAAAAILAANDYNNSNWLNNGSLCDATLNSARNRTGYLNKTKRRRVILSKPIPLISKSPFYTNFFLFSSISESNLIPGNSSSTATTTTTDWQYHRCNDKCKYLTC